jgi:hypothetical protein
MPINASGSLLQPDKGNTSTPFWNYKNITEDNWNM